METEHSGLCSDKSAARFELCQPTTPRLCVVRVSTWPSPQINVVETFNTALRILLMEEILHYLGCIKPCVNNGTQLLINWCRISSINSSSHVLSSHYFLPANPSIKLFVRGTGKPFSGTSSSAGVLGPSTSPFLVLMVVSPADCHVHTRRLIILFEEDVSVYS